MPPRKQAPVWTVGNPVAETPVAGAETVAETPVAESAETFVAEEPAEGYAQPEEFEA